jgi:hypothetical protein
MREITAAAGAAAAAAAAAAVTDIKSLQITHNCREYYQSCNCWQLQKAAALYTCSTALLTYKYML